MGTGKRLIGGFPTCVHSGLYDRHFAVQLSHLLPALIRINSAEPTGSRNTGRLLHSLFTAEDVADRLLSLRTQSLAVLAHTLEGVLTFTRI